MLLNGFVGASIASLGRLRETVGAAELDKAADILAGAQTLYLPKQRCAFVVVSYLAYALSKLGMCTVPLDNAGGMPPNRPAWCGRSMRAGGQLLALHGLHH